MADLPRLVMMGTGTFARPTFEAILAEASAQVVGLVTQPDREGGQQRGSTRQTGASLKEIAVARGIPIYQPESINTPEGVAQLQQWKPDLLVVAAYGQILKKEVHEAARWGGINVHGSLLPKYRGAAPVAHAILKGETTTGVTIIRMTTGLDAGDMLAQASLEIGPDETAGELEARLAPLGAQFALEVIHKAREAGGISPLPATKQDPALVTKAPKLKKEDGLIDWSQSAERVVRQVRAMQPWPTAYTFLHRSNSRAQRLIVQSAHLGFRMDDVPPELRNLSQRFFSDALQNSEPGKVLFDPVFGNARWKTRILVSTGLNAIEILTLQPAGKKLMTAAEFLRGYPLQPGDCFSSKAE